mgnify:CR=1 FL=1
MDKSVDLVFDNLFKEYYGKNKLLFENYRKIYNLPTVKSECSVSEKLFQYCLRKKYFVLLLIYDDDGKVYFDRNMSDILCWGLPGGSVKNTETINQTLNRIAQNVNKNIIIGDVEPVTLIENIFNYKGKNAHELVLFYNVYIDSKDYKEKYKVIDDNIERLGISNIDVQVYNALDKDDSLVGKADIVIADLPCSGLGIMGRKPDIRYNISIRNRRNVI